MTLILHLLSMSTACQHHVNEIKYTCTCSSHWFHFKNHSTVTLINCVDVILHLLATYVAGPKIDFAHDPPKSTRELVRLLVVRAEVHARPHSLKPPGFETLILKKYIAVL